MFRIPLTFCFLRFWSCFCCARLFHVGRPQTLFNSYFARTGQFSWLFEHWLCGFFSYWSIVRCLQWPFKTKKCFSVYFYIRLFVFIEYHQCTRVLHIIHTIEVNTFNILCMYDQGVHRNCPITITSVFIL